MKKQHKPLIGIISGIGPLAGADVLTKVFQYSADKYGAVLDSEYPDLIFYNHGIVGVDNKGSLSNVFEEELVKVVKSLEAQGANIIGIACNTAHFYLEKIAIKPASILVNLPQEVAHKAHKVDQCYLLLTSNASKKKKLYHDHLNKLEVCFR